MTDINSRRRAYRNAARANFDGDSAYNETERQEAVTGTASGTTITGVNKQSMREVKVYHAHGYAVYHDIVTGNEDPSIYSSFCEVFFSYEQAKEYLLKRIKNSVDYIYQNDPNFRGVAIDDKEFYCVDSSWRKEYIQEYVDYSLVISEITYGYDGNAPVDFSSPQKIDWHLRYTGDVLTRYYVFGSKEYECRPNDLLPVAGTKFKRGDLVKYVNWKCPDDYKGILVVLNAPQKPQDETAPWENCYEVLCIEHYYDPRRSGLVSNVEIHEEDLRLCNQKELQDNASRFFNEPSFVLQKVVLGTSGLENAVVDKILKGDVLFNCAPSWQSIPELK